MLKSETKVDVPSASGVEHHVGLRVAELAKRAGVTPATVRYYARIGLLSPGREPRNGYRRFHASDVRRLRFIRKAQYVGLGIRDIRRVLAQIDAGEAPCTLVRSLVDEHLEQVDAEIGRLMCRRARIEQARARWALTGASVQRREDEMCPLIDRLPELPDHTGSRQAVARA